MSKNKVYMERYNTGKNNMSYSKLSSDYVTLKIRDFKYLYPNIKLPDEIKDNIDSSYYVRVRKLDNGRGMELEFSPNKNEWEYVR